MENNLSAIITQYEQGELKLNIPNAKGIERDGKKLTEFPAKITIPVFRVGPTVDPRPDLADDTGDWQRLLGAAYIVAPELWGALHGFRCCGARLSPNTADRGKRITPGDWDRGIIDYREAARKWLEPFAGELKKLMRNL